LCADEISNNAAVGSQVLALVTSAPFEKLSLSFKSLKQCTWCPNDPPLHTTLAPLTLAVSSTNNTPGEGKKKKTWGRGVARMSSFQIMISFQLHNFCSFEFIPVCLAPSPFALSSPEDPTAEKKRCNFRLNKFGNSVGTGIGVQVTLITATQENLFASFSSN